MEGSKTMILGKRAPNTEPLFFESPPPTWSFCAITDSTCIWKPRADLAVTRSPFQGAYVESLRSWVEGLH